MSSLSDDKQGHCVMRGTCGGESIFSPQLPCPDNGPPHAPTQKERDLLASVCGAEFADGLVCCNNDQVETLRDRMAQADVLISSCPACRNNFHEFFCSFTCSPNQSSFLNITSTQKSNTGKTAVKSIDFRVSEEFGTGFYDSCKSVQLSAGNTFAMDFIGGGAKNYHDFFKFLGKKSSLGSPFQIDFPTNTLAPVFDATPRNCADSGIGSRCTCTDCPSVCPTLPYVPPPGSEPTCHVGALSCLTFVLVLGYALAILGFLGGLFLQRRMAKRREASYGSVNISPSDSTLDTPLSPRRQAHQLVGASSLAGHEAEESNGVSADTRGLGRGAALLDPIETVQPRQYPLNAFLRRSFYRLGLAAASYPWLTFAVVFAIVGLLNLGWQRFEIETDPVRLWVAPDSEAKLQKEYFDEHFGPFYRTEQIFITSADKTQPVLSWDRLRYWMDIEADIRQLRSPSGLALSDVCFQPMGPGTGCVVQSIGAWFGNDIDDYDEDTWAERLLDCANTPVECRPDFGLPLTPPFVLGGIPTEKGRKNFLDSKALVVTYVVSNSLNQTEVDRAEDWERTLRGYLQGVADAAPEDAGLRIAFSTGVSLEEELNKSTNMDVRIVVLSYLAMFFYVALTLGSGNFTRDEESVSAAYRRWALNFPKLFKRSSVTSSGLVEDADSKPTFFPPLPRSIFVGSKFTLGLFGIGLVILSVSSSVGFFSALGVKVTLIIAEVIPFLVLAVGVDNIFILVHELDRQNLLHGPNADPSAVGPHVGPNGGSILSPSTARATFDGSGDDSIEAQSLPTYFSAEERVARSLARMGPSILLSTVTETLAFALGALVPMPAVRNFALYAAGSVLLNAALQVTVFISALTLDLRRVEASRVDCFPCIQLPGRIALLDVPPSRSGLGRIARFIRRYYAPFLLKPAVKSCVVAFFSGVFVLSAISIQHLQLGLDQRLALPSESYLIPYFNHLDDYFEVGPPVYFVTQGGNVTTRPVQQEVCGKFTTCNDFSIANVLEIERNRTASSFIAQPASIWIDDFLHWLNPANEMCCRVRRRDPGTFCTPRDRERLCMPCMANAEPAWNITMNGLPEGDEFIRYLKQWLASPPNEDCGIAGAAAYADALSLSDDGNNVEAAHVRTYNKPLKTQDDFINALAASRRIADDLSERTGLKVFPYSLFHVFFDQYAHIVGITQELLGLGLASVLIVTALFLGSWRTGTIVTAVVALTVTSCMGVMGIWGISLNAISVVNLVISLGIAVEFCAHVARAFMSAGSGLPVDHPAGQKERDDRMFTALVDVGPSVLSGITFTKLIGMAVLGLTRSRLLEIYYFRMWLTLILSGALHGLVLLPVILSLAGGPGFPYQEADEEWMANAIRDDYEYTPFLAEEESVHSD